MTAEAAFEQVLNCMGQMRPDGNRGAREWQERKGQHQHWCAEAARSEASAWNRRRSRSQDSPNHKQYPRNRIVRQGDAQRDQSGDAKP